MEKAGWLGWPFSVASRGDCVIGIRKDQPGYTIDNYTISILCLNIVYPSVRVYSKSIHIYTHIIYDIYLYIYIIFVHLGFKYKYDHYIHIIIQIHARGVFGPLMIPRLVEQTITSCSSWGEASLGDFTWLANWSWRLRETCWFEASERDHYMGTKDVERWFYEPILHLLSVNCPYPSYSLHSNLLQSCRVRIQIKTISSIYLHIIIDIFYIVFYVVYIYYDSI